MSKRLDGYKQTTWEHDINRFYQYKKLLQECSLDSSRELCKVGMRRIKEKYPQHLKNEQID